MTKKTTFFEPRGRAGTRMAVACPPRSRGMGSIDENDVGLATNRYDFVKGAQKNAVLNTYA
jgi:hypothetical protein